MFSLKAKVTTALLATSFAAIALFGLTAQGLIKSGFGELVLDRAFFGFSQEVAAYYDEHGSWEAAAAAEEFLDFIPRFRATLGPGDQAQRGRGGSQRPPDGARPGRAGPGARGGPPGGRGARGGPPGGRGARGGPPGGRAGVPPDRLWRGDGGPAGGRGGPLGQPPRFLVIDAEGVVQLPLDPFEAGDVIGEDLDGDRRRIDLNGSVIGYAVSLTRPALTQLEQDYLDNIERAWMYALLAAFLILVPLGLLFGGRLSGTVSALTRAVSAMGEGDLRQVVEVRSKDEMGALSQAFNRMSTDLADTYEALHESNATINEQSEKLKELSTRDDLTGLFNRREFNEQARRMYGLAGRYEQPLVFLMGDIDLFKEINDRFSHSVGDDVLRAIAAIFCSSTREIDVVARYGGEEFVIAFPETPIEEAVGLAERLRDAIKEHPWSDIHPEMKVTISMGLSADTGLGSFEEMLAAADAKLYEAKESGRDRVCY